MMLSMVCRIMIIEVAIRQISKICMILHIIRKSNKIIGFITLSKYYPNITLPPRIRFSKTFYFFSAQFENNYK